MESPTTKTMQDVEATTLKTRLEQREALLIDVREAPEYAAEHIPDATLLPLSTFDPTHVPQEARKTVVLHCVMGMRSAQAGQKLLDAGHAFKCFCTGERLEEMREAQKAAKQPPRYDGLCLTYQPMEVARR